MSTEGNKAAKRRYFEAFTTRDLTVFAKLFAPDYTLHTAGHPDVHGPEELKTMVSASFESLSEVRLIAHDMVAEDDKVATRWTLTAVQVGDFMGAATTGKPLSFSGVVIDRFVDGRIVEAWDVYVRNE
jgi:steroid delta-isomerase-like uncharacterized protein